MLVRLQKVTIWWHKTDNPVRYSTQMAGVCGSLHSSDSGLDKLLWLNTAVLCSAKAALRPHSTEQHA